MELISDAVSIFKLNHADNDINHPRWLRIKEAFESMESLMNKDSLETVLLEHKTLPKVLGEIAAFFSSNWWLALRKSNCSLDCGAFNSLIAYLRLLRLFFFQKPTTILERNSNEWLMSVLQILSRQAHFVSQDDQMFVLAMVIAGLVPSHWLTDKCNHTVKLAFEKYNLDCPSDILSLPDHELQKSLLWACCIAKCGSHQDSIRKFIVSLKMINGILSKECFLLYKYLQDVTNTWE